MIESDPKLWGFSVSKFDQRLYFKRGNDDVIYLLLVVDDMPFATNKQELLDDFKRNLQQLFEDELYGKLTSFIEWSFIHERQRITIHQN